MNICIISIQRNIIDMDTIATSIFLNSALLEPLISMCL